MRTKQAGLFGVVAVSGFAAMTGCAAGHAASRVEPASRDDVSEATVGVREVVGIDGYFVADIDGVPGGAVVLRGFTASGHTFEHHLAIEPASVDAVVGDPDRGFVYLIDSVGSAIVVHEIGRAIDRRIELDIAIEPATVALIDGGLGLRLCAEAPGCQIETLSLRDPEASEVRTWP